MISKPSTYQHSMHKYLITTVIMLVILVCLLTSVHQINCQQHKQISESQVIPELYSQALESGDHNLPGHYEFDVASPNEEPPTIRKPPYILLQTRCEGLDPFNAFSANDTLCGDLNKGFIPLNPLSHSFDGHPYPFELIKNKTLSFLAKALPVLKAEYETIPKVARFLPTNHLLNPTLSQALTNEQLQVLNSQLANINTDLSDVVAPTPFKRRRRKKRSVSSKNKSLVSKALSADLDAEASVVVKSEHSLAGRTRPTATNSNQPTGISATAKPGQLIKDTRRESTSKLAAQKPLQTSKPLTPQTTTTTTAKSATISNNNEFNNNAKIKDYNDDNDERHAADSKPISQDKPFDSKFSDKSSKLQSTTNSPNSNEQQHQQQQHQQQRNSQQEHHQTNSIHRKGLCNDVSSAFYHIVCQAATSIVEGEKAPAWLQVAKQLGNAYSNAGESVTSSPSSSIWSTLASFLQTDQPITNSNKNDLSFRQSNSFSNVFWPLTTLFSNSNSNQNKADNIDRSDQSELQQKDKNNHATSGNSISNSLKGFGSYLTPFAVGFASRTLASLADYVMPTNFRSASSTFARRKKPFDPLETFVDSANFITDKQANNNQQLTSATTTSNLKQPPTPCQSVEEYISPTFARNYMGAWKYVVQIPYEGYFAQTIQRTSCVKQKCDFMEGMCHEAPRWASLLVADIFYPNAVFSQQQSTASPTSTSIAESLQVGSIPNMAANSILVDSNNAQQQIRQNQQLQHQGQPSNNIMATSQSTTSMRQMQPLPSTQNQQRFQPNPQSSVISTSNDPLQMTDSQSSYNFHLSNALAQAATELGLDPTNAEAMQQLANAYNYQFVQRNGIVQNNKTPAYSLTNTIQQQVQPQSIIAQNRQILSKDQIARSSQQLASNGYYQASNLKQPYNDYYLMNLVAAALQQNPHLSINDIIAALQATNLANKRRKRDINQTNTVAMQQNHQHYKQPNYQNQYQMRRNDILTNSQVSHQSSTDINAIDSSNKIPQVSSATGGNNQVVVNQAPSVSNVVAVAPTVSNQQQAISQNQLSSNNVQQTNTNDQQTTQTECDGHDKIGCYVVRVYYDWFLINGSCKCWKTNMSGAASASQTTAANNLLKRIFTG